MPRRRSGGPTAIPSRRICPERGRLEPADHAQKRALAAARRAEEDDELVPRDREVERRCHHRQVAESLGDALEGDIAHRVSPQR